MRITRESDGYITLTVPLRNKRDGEIDLEITEESLFGIYPVKLNYIYRYSVSKEEMYLRKDKASTTGLSPYVEDVYNEKKLRHLGEHCYREDVLKYNLRIALLAHVNGIPNFLKRDNTLEELTQGTSKVGEALRKIEEQYQREDLYETVEYTEEETKEVELLGDIYSMLVTMTRMERQGIELNE